jgi:hypothetical protein
MSDLEKNPIKDIIEGDFAQRVHEVDSGVCTFDTTSEQIEAWRADGRFSVFNAGTYDILTLNHILGLVQCRTLGAMALLGLNKIETKKDQRVVHDVAASDSIHLMVTLDTNRALEEGKSRRPQKGGAPKPTLDWYSRAIMLAMQSIPSPGYESRRGIVDYITRHGPGCCGVCEDGLCTNEDNAAMAVKLQPDLVVVNSESFKTVADLKRYKEEGQLPGTQIAVIREKDNEYFDPILGSAVTTTSIIKRVRS